MKEVLNRLKKKGYDNEALEAYINNSNIKKIYTEEELKELKAIWYGDEIMEQEKEILVQLSEDDVTITSDLEDMTKDQLDEYSINTYGIDLDKRFTKENMLEELEEELKKQNEE